jgi:serine/alanine adding enzyme
MVEPPIIEAIRHARRPAPDPSQRDTRFVSQFRRLPKEAAHSVRPLWDLTYAQGLAVPMKSGLQPKHVYSPAMQVESVTDPDLEWDAYAEARPGACLGHAAAWASILRESYGLAPHYLLARSGGEIAGILPLVSFRTLRGARELISLPFLDAAGVLADNPEAADALRRAAQKRAGELGARWIELRSQPAASEDTEAAPPLDELDRVDLVLRLEADEESQWKALRAKVRNQTRKAEKEGLSLLPGDGADALLDAFFGPFAVNMRDLGSPVHARRFFAVAAARFGDRLRFIATGEGGRSAGGLVAIHYGGAVNVPWASTLRSERRRCPNNQIYWEALRWAIDRGACELDFGRSARDGGTYRFKLGWGAEERALLWQRFGAAGESLPLSGVRDSNVLSRLSDLWTRLPVPVASWLGSKVRPFISA